jgi:hypothetical protein
VNSDWLAGCFEQQTVVVTTGQSVGRSNKLLLMCASVSQCILFLHMYIRKCLKPFIISICCVDAVCQSTCDVHLSCHVYFYYFFMF